MCFHFSMVFTNPWLLRSCPTCQKAETLPRCCEPHQSLDPANNMHWRPLRNVAHPCLCAVPSGDKFHQQTSYYLCGAGLDPPLTESMLLLILLLRKVIAHYVIMISKVENSTWFFHLGGTLLSWYGCCTSLCVCNNCHWHVTVSGGCLEAPR